MCDRVSAHFIINKLISVSVFKNTPIISTHKRERGVTKVTALCYYVKYRKEPRHMVLNRSAAASPPCSTSEVCFASRRPRSAAASPHGRVPFGGRPLDAAVSVPRGWRVFETQRWRAQSRRQKLRRRALKGRPPRKENLMPPPFQCRNRPSRGDITIGARALFEASHPPTRLKW